MKVTAKEATEILKANGFEVRGDSRYLNCYKNGNIIQIPPDSNGLFQTKRLKRIK